MVKTGVDCSRTSSAGNGNTGFYATSIGGGGPATNYIDKISLGSAFA